jgi:HNH endonuclease/EVE domain
MLSQSAKKLLLLLIEKLKYIEAGDPYTYFSYREIHDELNMRLTGKTYGQSLRNQGLGELADWLYENNLPAITGIIISKESYMPGRGYYEAFQREDNDFRWWGDEIIKSTSVNWKSIIEQLEGVSIDASPNTWIFQGNPKRFQMDEYIKSNKTVWWSVNQEHFLDDISLDDVVYLWRADGRKKGTGGIIARGKVSGEPVTNVAPSQFWMDATNTGSHYSVPIEIESHLIDSEFIRRVELLQDPVLQDLLILRMANNTNYLVDSEHAELLNKWWFQRVQSLHTPFMKTVQNDMESEEAQFDHFYSDGEVREYFGNRYERNAKNRSRAIEIHGSSCLACGFNFEAVYGLHGKDFIEVHHIQPLSTIKQAIEINPETDLVPLCSNCHSMVHRKKDDVLSVEQVKNLLIIPTI